eukprot:CAMPEP_0115511416 /NCGR_PEP_ID=MMETSP0271-20121206/73958_1 /TAXON_ID=71861 /ORGANISM="Scrippsiella trochoidea, Strain CCMP3099" /LENGTH=105 /DNA_ID=CAMNT_0002941493 /DNA_START=1 /DNA_END=318 /DNA_ORIENTATION=+
MQLGFPTAALVINVVFCLGSGVTGCSCVPPACPCFPAVHAGKDHGSVVTLERQVTQDHMKSLFEPWADNMALLFWAIAVFAVAIVQRQPFHAEVVIDLVALDLAP